MRYERNCSVFPCLCQVLYHRKVKPYQDFLWGRYRTVFLDTGCRFADAEVHDLFIIYAKITLTPASYQLGCSKTSLHNNWILHTTFQHRAPFTLLGVAVAESDKYTHHNVTNFIITGFKLWKSLQIFPFGQKKYTPHDSPLSVEWVSWQLAPYNHCPRKRAAHCI